MRQRTKTAKRLLSDVEWAMSHGLGPTDLVPMLERLVTHTAARSSAGLYARSHLSALLVTQTPWRAARLAHEVVRHAQDPGAWAVLGLALTLMGHYRSALQAYRRCLALDRSDPSCQHNYGHLLDVVFNRPEDALRYLGAAHHACPAEPEMAASYAHALTRTGRVAEARRLLMSALACDEDRVEAWLTRWQPAPSDESAGALKGSGGEKG